jgi:hypothetical protein
MSTHAEMAALLNLEGGKNDERKALVKGADLFVVRLGGRALEPLDSIWKRNSRSHIPRTLTLPSHLC